MPDAYLIGTSCTRFGKQPGASFKDLTRDAYLAVLADAGLDSGDRIGNAWFGNCGMAQWGQGNIRGQVCFTPLVREGLFPERVGMTNVEGGCATASMALHGAWKDVLSGTADLSLAMGVEKTFVPESVPDAAAKQQAIFDNGIDQLDPADWMAYYAAAGEEAGKPSCPRTAAARCSWTPMPCRPPGTCATMAPRRHRLRLAPARTTRWAPRTRWRNTASR